jgi:hypothetical protein
LRVSPQLAFDGDQPTMLANQQDVDEACAGEVDFLGDRDHPADARFELRDGQDRWVIED